ncbi:MAG: hypothetical protein WA957_10250 [Alteraurantiacibacter sp.]
MSMPACTSPSNICSSIPTSSGVSITPGITQFTRTPFCATSLAAVRVSPTAPCFAAL